MHQIYRPNETPMSVFWMFSGSASSLRATFEDPNNGQLYRNIGAYTDRANAKGVEFCKEKGLHCFSRSRKEFYQRNHLDPGEESSRNKFYEMLLREIEQFKPDVICLSGYMHIVTGPLLEAYEDCILNVHPADLSMLSGDYVFRLDASQLSARDAKILSKLNGLQKKFTGDNAVHDTVKGDEVLTRSTVHIATKEVDGGPIVVQSKAFKVGTSFDEDLLVYAKRLQEKMKVEGDGPAYLKALEFISTGSLWAERNSVEINNKDAMYTTLFLNNRELPYCGHRLDQE